MGGIWEVALWGKWYVGADYSYHTAYMGNSLWRAIKAFWRHRNGYGCVTLHYRGGKK